MTDNTEGELERLQFGRWVGDNTLLWVGRYHTPTAYWDMIYHHSPYLQTSISRPEIMNHEDDGGVLPIHIWGLLMTHTVSTGNKEWQVDFGFGSAPKKTPTGLEALDALDPRSSSDRLAVELLGSYVPDTSSSKELGIFASLINLPSDRIDADHVRQTQTGAYMNWSLGSLHTISSIFAVRSDVSKPGATTESHAFYSGYFHFEFQTNPTWRPYLRYEGSIGIDNDPYLNLLTNQTRKQ